MNWQKNTSIRCRLCNIDGVGVDLTRFYPVSEEEKQTLRLRFGYAGNEFILLYIAEFIPRKNHLFLLNQLPTLRESIKNIRVIFAGKGVLLDDCKQIAEKLGVSQIAAFLGYSNDIDALCKIADIYIAPSKQEGLPVSVLEAMASGLPVVASNIRGHTDVIEHGHNGFLFDLHNPAEMTKAVIMLYNDCTLRKEISQYNALEAKKYSVETAVQKMAGVYRQYMNTLVTEVDRIKV